MDSLAVLVRTARPEDYAALVALFDELDDFHRRARPDFFQRFEGPARSREQVEKWLAGPGSTLLAAEIRHQVVGLAVLLTRPSATFAGAVPRKVIELDNLVVDARFRSRRVGRALLTATVRWSRGQGATHIEVGVHAFNHEARLFYERFGFGPSIHRLVLGT